MNNTQPIFRRTLFCLTAALLTLWPYAPAMAGKVYVRYRPPVYPNNRPLAGVRVILADLQGNTLWTSGSTDIHGMAHVPDRLRASNGGAVSQGRLYFLAALSSNAAGTITSNASSGPQGVLDCVSGHLGFAGQTLERVENSGRPGPAGPHAQRIGRRATLPELIRECRD